MFAQVVQGRTDAPDEVRRRFERWRDEVMPGAIGFLGSTGGVTGDGSVITIARFESADAARRNSERREQDEWWSDTATYLDDVAFHESTDVAVVGSGDLDSAGFVQVMQGTSSDRQRMRELESELFPRLQAHRAEILGALSVAYDPDALVEAVYFTSEAEARAGEKADMPGDVAAGFEELNSLGRIERFLDLTEPWLLSP